MGNEHPQFNEIDERFYLESDTFFARHYDTALTYDDVSLATRYSEVLPRQTSLATRISEALELHMPVISADMDTVTEAPMAIGMALYGGMGLIHYNMPEKAQIQEIARVKNHVHGLIQDPITVDPESMIGEVLDLISKKGFNFNTFPVVDKQGVLMGLLPGRVVRERYRSRPVTDAMTPRSRVHTLNCDEIAGNPIEAADRFFDENIGIHKILVVDSKNRLHGLFTLSDIDRIKNEKGSSLKPARDHKFRLVCGAAVSAVRDASGQLDRERILGHIHAMVQEGVDAVAVSTAHGYSKGVGEMVRLIRQEFQEKIAIIAGNVTSAEGVEFLANAGADAIKVGQGPGSICTTRIVAGVGIPQLTALYTASRQAIKSGVKVLADGGINKSGDIVKALTMADAVICGGLLAGCREAPGKLMEINGKLYKQYRGMGSLEAMKAGSAARYAHDRVSSFKAEKIAAEGIEALKEVSGSLDEILKPLAGGIQSGMGYLGARNISELKEKARFVRISHAGLREASPHDVVEVKTSEEPN